MTRRALFKLTLSVSYLQGSKGDIGLPGPQGPAGVGAVGPPVRHKCFFVFFLPWRIM